MSHPSVTFIINTWNHQGFIADAFLSAVNQADELIVVDDGSTDGTWNVLEGLRSVHSNVLTICKKNGGQASACQVGMEHAHGDVVIFLDGDDMLAPNAVQRVKETWTPGVSKIQWQMQVVNERGHETGQVFPKFPKNDFDARQLLIDTGAYPDTPTSGNAYCAAMVRCWIDGLVKWIDGELNGAAAMTGDVITLREPLTFYRVHGNNDCAMRDLDRNRFARFVEHSETRLAWLKARFPELRNTTLDLDLKSQEWKLAAGSRNALAFVLALLRAPFGRRRKALTAAWALLVVMGSEWAIRRRFCAG